MFIAVICNLSLQHPFVTQLLTRNLIIELLDMANNPELHSAHTHSMDDNDLEVSAAVIPHFRWRKKQPFSQWIVFSLMLCWQVGEMAPDKIQSAGKHLPVERTLSEEQCKDTLTYPYKHEDSF